MIPRNQLFKISETNTLDWLLIASFGDHHYFYGESYDALAVVIGEEVNPSKADASALKLVDRRRFIELRAGAASVPVHSCNYEASWPHWLHLSLMEAMWIAGYYQVPISVKDGGRWANFRAVCISEHGIIKLD